MGSVASPISAPDRRVEIRITPCDASPGFHPDPASNVVSLTFQPPGPGADTLVPPAAITGKVVQDCTLAGGRCTTFSFLVPDTSGILVPDGLAGPAEIIVTVGAETVARIDALAQPTTGCDRQPERVFRQFTVLPRPNLMADLVNDAAPQVRATVDGGGNLLVPLDHWGQGLASVLAETPGAQVAILLTGTADVAAQGAGDPNTILQVLAAQASPERYVRSFTLDGRPLPPLLRLTNVGELFGTSDAAESVLRFARDDGEGGPALFDLSDRLHLGRGPILIGPYDVTREQPLPLVSLRPGSAAIGYVREESREGLNLNPDGDQTDLVVQVVDPSTGVATNTARAVSTVTETGIVTPAITSAGDLVAFLESEAGQGVNYNGDADLEDSVLRVYRGDGSHLTAATTVEVDGAPLVNRRTLAVSGERVFFRTPGSAIASGDSGLTYSDEVAVSPDGAHVYLAGSIHNVVSVFARDPGSGGLTFLGNEPAPYRVNQLAISPDGLHLYVKGFNNFQPGHVMVFARDAFTGGLTFLVEYVEGLGGIDGITGGGRIAVSPDGLNLYVVGSDNGCCGSEQKLSVFRRNPLTGALTFVGVALADLVGGDGGNIAFSPDGAHVYVNSYDVQVFDRSPIDGALTLKQTIVLDGQGMGLSPDGRRLYVAPTFYGQPTIVVFDRNQTTGLLTRVGGWEATTDDLNVYRLMVSPDGSRLLTCSSEGLLVWEIDARSGSADPYAQLTDQTCVFLALSPDGRDVYVAAQAPSIRGYSVRGGLGVFDAATNALRTVGTPATRVAVAGGRALYLRPEDLGGAGNGDGDDDDHVVELLDATGPFDVVTPLGVAGRRIALSDELIAFSVPEGSEHDHDRNGDFDTIDGILAVAEIGPAPVVRDLGVAADIVAATGTSVVFSRPEAMEPPNASGCAATIPPGGCDLNGNGTATDRVLHVYRHKFGGVGKIENTGIAVSRGNVGFEGLYDPRYPDRPDFFVAGNVVAVLTDEAATGVDLNQNGSTTDHPLQLVDISSSPSEVINPELAAIPCSFPSCEPGVPYRLDPVRGTVSFVVWEASQGVDLDGNGNNLDFVLNVYNLLNGQRQLLSLFPSSGIPQSDDVTVARLPEPFLEGQLVYSQVRESDVDTDLNGDGAVTTAVAVVLFGDADDDGVFDDFDTCVEDANAPDVDADADGLGDFACDPNPAGCPAAARSGCTPIAVSGKGSLQVSDAANNAKDRISWSWNKGGDTPVARFGNPVTGFTNYAFCVYDANGGRPQPVMGAVVRPDRICDPTKGKRCWSRTGANGFKMRDKAGTDGGITQITLKAGTTGKAKIQVKGGGAVLAMPTLGLAPPVRVQLVALDGTEEACWEATYSSPIANDGERFKAKSD
ncbi:MAG: beta-propeller fold lactonase family protein [Deltaproteobacteria bacterium]|nr:beta-propeller fold lactonase family protein [Deltaproteobacteria bacterium]